MSEWYPDEETLVASVFAVTGVVLLATVLFATYAYWDGYAAGRCYRECGGGPRRCGPTGRARATARGSGRCPDGDSSIGAVLTR